MRPTLNQPKELRKWIKTSARPRGILVTLSSERDRDNVLSAYKRYNRDNKANQLSSTHIGIQGERCLMYVAEHLSPETKQLHAAARLAARNLSYKYVRDRHTTCITKYDGGGRLDCC
ncbi:hypothetical protein ACJJTC_013322 [Scirpophaga incertulas]